MKFIKALIDWTNACVREYPSAWGLNKSRSTCSNVIVVAYKASRIILSLFKALYVTLSVRIPRKGCIFKRRSNQCHISFLFNLCTAWFQWSSNKSSQPFERRLSLTWQRFEGLKRHLKVLKRFEHSQHINKQGKLKRNFSAHFAK